MLEATQLYTLGFILAGVLLFSLVERRLGIAPLLGAVFIGIILGGSGLGVISYGQIPEWLNFLALMGGMLILFLVGMETDIRELFSTSKKALSITMLGVFFPAVFVIIVDAIFQFTKGQLLLLVAATIVTATPTSLAIILSMKKTHTRAAQYLHASTVMDNLLGIFFVLILTAVHETGAVNLYEILKIVAILGFLIALAYTTMPKIVRWVFDRFGHPSHHSRLTIAFAFVVFFGAITSQFLFEAAFGAFLAGMMLSEVRPEYKQQLARTIRDVGESLFFPIFFLTIGLAVNLPSIIFSTPLLFFLAAYTAFSVLGKFGGGYYGGLLSKLTKKEALAVGAGLIPRGGIGLIIAHVGLVLGRFTEAQFSVVVLMVFISTIIGVAAIYKTFSKLR